MVKETRMKQTDIGLIPEDWKLKSFTDILTFQSTASYSRAEIKDQGEFGYIHYGDIHTKYHFHIDVEKKFSGYIEKSQLKTYSKIEQGDLIMADASEDYSGIGKAVEVLNVGNNQYVISGLHTFLIRDKIKNTFALGFKGYFQNNPLIKKQYDSLATGLKVFSLSKGSFKNIQIPLPPLAEQEAIATALSDCDSWIDSIEEVLAKKRLIKQGAMQELLTPKEDWEVKKLGEMTSIYTGKKNNQDKIENGIFPFFVRSQKIERINSYSFDGEAILVPGEGNLGSIFHYINGKFDFHQRVYKVSDFNGIDGKYTYWYFRMYFGQHALQNTVKATVDSIRLPTLLAFDIYFPKSLSEQIHIATILSDMDLEIEALEEKLHKARQIKQGMMQELLTGRVRLV